MKFNRSYFLSGNIITILIQNFHQFHERVRFVHPSQFSLSYKHKLKSFIVPSLILRCYVVSLIMIMNRFFTTSWTRVFQHVEDYCWNRRTFKVALRGESISFVEGIPVETLCRFRNTRRRVVSMIYCQVRIRSVTLHRTFFIYIIFNTIFKIIFLIFNYIE